MCVTIFAGSRLDYAARYAAPRELPKDFCHTSKGSVWPDTRLGVGCQLSEPARCPSFLGRRRSLWYETALGERRSRRL